MITTLKQFSPSSRLRIKLLSDQPDFKVMVEDYQGGSYYLKEEVDSLLDIQPIETAPKDGSPVIALFPDNTKGWIPIGVKWITEGHEFLVNEGFWSLLVAGKYAEDSEVHPTHWLPALDFLNAELRGESL